MAAGPREDVIPHRGIPGQIPLPPPPPPDRNEHLIMPTRRRRDADSRAAARRDGPSARALAQDMSAPASHRDSGGHYSRSAAPCASEHNRRALCDERADTTRVCPIPAVAPLHIKTEGTNNPSATGGFSGHAARRMGAGAHERRLKSTSPRPSSSTSLWRRQDPCSTARLPCSG